MRGLLFGMLILMSPTISAWYQEYGSEISGTGAYDTTERQPLLIAFNQKNKCQSASLWLDRFLYAHELSDSPQKTGGTFKIDNFKSWTLSLDVFETDNWLPGVFVLRQEIASGMIKQLRHGNILTISVGKHSYVWELAGSNLAIKSAYIACLE